MTPSEAIEKEIKREEKELKDLENELQKMANKNYPTPRDFALAVRPLVLRVIDMQNEIEGKKLALSAVKAKPDALVAAINTEYDAEHKKADELGRKVQAMREKIFLDHLDPKNPPPAKSTLEELKKLDQEFDSELAKLRGKAAALGVVSALAGR
jgi:DNA repair exonuclease SbcCD ATPase subunit